MATTIYFNGRVTSIPGSYSEVDASGLSKVGLGASGVVACIGEVEGSQPAVVQAVSNPGKVSKLFRSGDLLEAGNMLFDPSKDSDIPGGAQEVKFVKTNPATQSTLTLSNGAGNALDLTSADYGAFTEKISVEVADGTAGGKAVTVAFEGNVEAFDDVGSDGVGTVTYSGGCDTATLAFTHAGGLVASCSDTTAGQDGDYVGSVANAGLDSQVTGQPTPSETVTCVSADAADTFAVTVYGVNGAGTPASENITLTGTTPVAGATTWQRIHGVYFPSTAAGTVTITGTGSATVISASTASAGLVDYVADPIELPGSTITVVADAATTKYVLIVGTNSSDVATLEEIQLNGTTVATSSTSWNSVSLFGLGDVEAARTATFDGWMVQAGTLSLVSADAADNTQTATVYGLDAGGAVQSEAVAMDGTTPVSTSGSWSRVLGVVLDVACAGNVTVTSGSGGTAIVVFTVTAAALESGVESMATSLFPDGTVAWASTGTVGSAMLVGINSAGSAALELLDLSGSTGTSATSWQQISAIAVGQQPAATNLALSFTAFTLTEAAYAALSDWEDFFDARNGWAFAKLTSTKSTAYAISSIDEFAATSVVGAAHTVLDVLSAIVSTLNAGSVYVTAAAATGATGAPSNTTFPQFLAGGIEGTTLFSHWQAALDALRDFRVNTIVVLTDNAAVHAAVIAHCVFMGAAGRSERDCVLGAPSGSSLTASKALSLAMNTRHARLLIQDVQRFNTSGTKERFSPPFTACLAAGMQAGSEVGTSLTFKHLNILDTFGNDATYTVVDDADSLIQAGLCMVEKVPNIGFRWLRNVTTHLIDDNLAYTEASVNEAVNYSVYNLRTALESIIGQKGFAGTVTAAQGLCLSILGQLIAAKTITSWKNLTIELTDDVMTIDLEIAPVIPVNFIKTTIHLVSATFEAAS